MFAQRDRQIGQLPLPHNHGTCKHSFSVLVVLEAQRKHAKTRASFLKTTRIKNKKAKTYKQGKKKKNVQNVQSPEAADKKTKSCPKNYHYSTLRGTKR